MGDCQCNFMVLEDLVFDRLVGDLCVTFISYKQITKIIVNFEDAIIALKFLFARLILPFITTILQLYRLN